MSQIVVLRDTREKPNFGWVWDESEWCEGTEITTLPTGDYTLQGFEKDFIIERKASTGEIAGCIYTKRFHNELERMQEYKWPFLLCEFSYDQLMKFPQDSGIPPKRWKRLRITSSFLLACITQIEMKYKTKVILVEKQHSKKIAESLFKWLIKTKM